MEFASGHTYLFPLSTNQTPHLWVIATNPDRDGVILVVSLTSLKGAKDQTVILHGGEHPFLKWETCVAYGLADLITCDALTKLLLCGSAKMHANMSHERTRLILDGFTASIFTKKRIVAFVKAYKSQISD